MIEAMNEEIASLRETISGMEASKKEDEERHSEVLAKQSKEYQEIIKQIENSRKESEKALDNSKAELEQWKESYSRMVEKIKHLKKDNESLEQTAEHYRNNFQRAESFNLREITRYFLDCPRCHNVTAVRYQNHGYFCKECNRPLSMDFVGEATSRRVKKDRFSFVPDDLDVAFSEICKSG